MLTGADGRSSGCSVRRPESSRVTRKRWCASAFGLQTPKSVNHVVGITDSGRQKRQGATEKSRKRASGCLCPRSLAPSSLSAAILHRVRPFSLRSLLLLTPARPLLALDAHTPRSRSSAMSSQSATTTTAYPRSYAQANPIDLTLDDDDEDIHTTERMYKRPCTMSRTFNATYAPSSSNAPLSRHQSSSSSGLSPAMSLSTLAPQHAPSIPSGSHAQHPPQPQPYYPGHDGPVPNTVQPPVFQGPSTSAAFFQPRPQAVPTTNPLDSAPPRYSQPQAGPSSNAAARQVIDLTDSPSPPPSHTPRSQAQPHLQPTMGNLPMDLPPKTPVCIGVLPATALVLYPISYTVPRDPNSLEPEWAPVRLQYEHLENRPKGTSENINVRPPSSKTPSGEVIPGEVFAVVEQKVATPLGPMLGKGLIRLDAKIRRNQNVSTVLPHYDAKLIPFSYQSCNCKCWSIRPRVTSLSFPHTCSNTVCS